MKKPFKLPRINDAIEENMKKPSERINELYHQELDTNETYKIVSEKIDLSKDSSNKFIDVQLHCMRQYLDETISMLEKKIDCLNQYFKHLDNAVAKMGSTILSLEAEEPECEHEWGGVTYVDKEWYHHCLKCSQTQRVSEVKWQDVK